MKENIKKFLAMSIVVLFVILTLVFLTKPNNPENVFKCPENLSSFEEYVENRAQTIIFLKKNNLQMTEEELMDNILQISNKKGCTNEAEYLEKYRKFIKNKI